MLEVSCRSIVRFQSWAYMSLKSGLTAAGPKLVIPREPPGSLTAMAPLLIEMGIANGGFPLNPVTMLVVGVWVMIAYAALTEGFPLLKGSQAKPTRGCKFLLLV